MKTIAMLKSVGLLIGLLAASVLAGCSSLSCGDPHPYFNSGTQPPLQVPAGLTMPVPDPAYKVSGNTSHPGEHTDHDAAGACLIAPPQLVPNQPAAAANTGPAGRRASEPPPPAAKAPSAAGSGSGTPMPATGSHAPPAVASAVGMV
ncbi:MAG: hypothetical protein KGJ56_00555 [Gammaproteobacteria bacterium]|nr:hypothetical protein [Gammaproteobacteria bacterium]